MHLDQCLDVSLLNIFGVFFLLESELGVLLFSVLSGFVGLLFGGFFGDFLGGGFGGGFDVEGLGDEGFFVGVVLHCVWWWEYDCR